MERRYTKVVVLVNDEFRRSAASRTIPLPCGSPETASPIVFIPSSAPAGSSPSRGGACGSSSRRPDRTLSFAAGTDALVPLAIAPGGRARLEPTGEMRRRRVVRGGALRARRRPRGRSRQLWPLPAEVSPVERLARGQVDGFEDFANRLDGLQPPAHPPGRRARLVPRRAHPDLPPPALRRRARLPQRSRALAAGRRGRPRQDGRGLPDPEPPPPHRPRRAHARRGARRRSPSSGWASCGASITRSSCCSTTSGWTTWPRTTARGSTRSTSTARRSSGSRRWSQRRRLTEQAVEAGIDLLVVDEAHHLRRPPGASRATRPTGPSPPSPALGRHVLLLTATPLEDDAHGFFRLLQLLRPEEFPEDESFDERLARREPLPPCTSATRRADIGGLPPRVPAPVDILTDRLGARRRLVRHLRAQPRRQRPGRAPQGGARLPRPRLPRRPRPRSLDRDDDGDAALAAEAERADPRVRWLVEQAAALDAGGREDARLRGPPRDARSAQGGDRAPGAAHRRLPRGPLARAAGHRGGAVPRSPRGRRS